jgi:hypothetical protein
MVLGDRENQHIQTTQTFASLSSLPLSIPPMFRSKKTKSSKTPSICASYEALSAARLIRFQDNTVVTASELWREQPVLFQVARRPGCQFCREEAAILESRRSIITDKLVSINAASLLDHYLLMLILTISPLEHSHYRDLSRTSRCRRVYTRLFSTSRRCIY